MRKTLLPIAAGLVAAAAFAMPAAAQSSMKINFAIHTTTANTFWAAVNRGFQDACDLINADCLLLGLRNDGDLQEQLTNLQASIAQRVDGIVTSLVDNTIFDDVVADAIQQGIPVIGANVDDTQGADGNARLSFIGQDLEQAGFDLAKGLSEQFPGDGPIKVLIGVADFSQNWAVQRGNGIERFMVKFAADNPDRDISWEKIESGLDLSTVGGRVAAFVQANPGTTAYFDVGFWEAGAAQAVRDLGFEPGQILLAGFDLVPIVLDEMDRGYVQLTVDQQPYLQGFLPVIQLYLMKKFGLSAWDVNTGKALVRPQDVATIRALSEQQVR